MESLGYLRKPLDRMKLVRSVERNLPLYYLALFSRHETAFKFWDDVLKYSTDQTNTWDNKSMSLLSKIEWTDATWNPVRGCTKISPGCKHCYAERFAERFRGVKGHPFEQGFDLRLVPKKLGEPLRWSEPRMIFVNSMSDLFQRRP